MDDWRLRGQEEYLKDLTLYKVRFPDFWIKAYAEKNAFYQMISTEAHRFVEQMRRGEEYLEGEKIQHFWHDHCEYGCDNSVDICHFIHASHPRHVECVVLMTKR